MRRRRNDVGDSFRDVAGSSSCYDEKKITCSLNDNININNNSSSSNNYNNNVLPVENDTTITPVVIKSSRFIRYIPNFCIHCMITYSFHIGSIIFLIIGIVLGRTFLHTSEECDMTWSRRQFIEIDLETNISGSHSANFTEHTKFQTYPYRVFKFVDSRDPRHLWAKVSQERDKRSDWIRIPILDNRWCTRTLSTYRISSNATAVTTTKNTEANLTTARTVTSTVVLYIPGHYGSYMQARSIGAHGIQWIRNSATMNEMEQKILEKLNKISTDRPSSDEDELMINDNVMFDDVNLFTYDVFAIDFQEEGGGFHGMILERQAEYIALVIKELLSKCQYYDSVVVVAHSMGGISAMLGSHYLVNTMKSDTNQVHKTIIPITAIITLASPHSYPVLSWSPSMYNVYKSIQMHSYLHNFDRDSDIIPTLISISGGWRDEMIPPEAPYCNYHTGALNLHAPDLIRDTTTSTTTTMNTEPHQQRILGLGMDHRSIVWCKNVLQSVRSIIYTVDQSTHTSHQLNRTYLVDDSNIVKTILTATHSKENIWNNTHQNFHRSVAKSQQNLYEKYGTYKAALMETGLMYNADVLVFMYIWIGAIYYCFDYKHCSAIRADRYSSYRTRIYHLTLSSQQIVVPVLLSVVQHQLRNMYNKDELDGRYLPFRSIIVLAFVADSLFRGIRFVTMWVLRGKMEPFGQKQEKPTQRWFSLVFFTWVLCAMFLFVSWLVLYGIFPDIKRIWLFDTESVCAIWTVLTTYSLATLLILKMPKVHALDCTKHSKMSQQIHSNSTDEWCNQQINYIVWALPTLIVLLFGDVIVILKGLVATKTKLSWCSPVTTWCMPIFVKFVGSHYILSKIHHSTIFSLSISPHQTNVIILVRVLLAAILFIYCDESFRHLRSISDHPIHFHPAMKALVTAAAVDTIETIVYISV